MARPDTTHPYGKRVLQLIPESKGLDVWELQIKLIGWGSGTDNDGIGNVMDPVRVTGTYDTTTHDAVMRFQKAHKLPVNGIVDAAVFRAIDREAALHPVLVHEMRCPCVHGDNDGPILCRCEKHPSEGKCDGFGKKRFDGKFLLEGKKLADGTDLSGEKLDLYDMKEHEGIDKALLWAVRALMHRAKVKKIKVVAGYRCWHDNYHHTDDTRWRHRRLTFHFGKAIEFYHDGECTEIGKDYTKDPCDKCEAIRKVALAKCGFQLRWQEPNRVSVAEGTKEARPPATPFAVHVNTVRRLEREEDDFVKTHFDGVQPLYEGKISAASFPMDLGSGLDPRSTPGEAFFQNVEKKLGGWFPMGSSRIWHTGIHLFADAEKEVYAIADGEIVACRAGEEEDEKGYGSRNFVLIKHQWPTDTSKVYYSLYMHLDAEKAATDAKVAWRKQLHLRTVDHVEALVPSPIFVLAADTGGTDRLTPKAWDPDDDEKINGLAPGERAEVSGVEKTATDLDDKAPTGAKVVQLMPTSAKEYVYTRLEGKDIGTRHAKDGTLAGKIDDEAVGLKDPIKVFAGDVVGKVAKAPTEAPLKDHGTFVHVETFSADKLLSGDGYKDIDASDEKKVADRKAVTEALMDKELLASPPDGVLLATDLKNPDQDPNRNALRSVVLKMQSAWDLDWKEALKEAESLSFMKDTPRDTLGDNFNAYRWWPDVKTDGKLPSSTVYHFHPIVLLLQIAYLPPS